MWHKVSMQQDSISNPCLRYAQWPQGVAVVSCRGEGPDARTEILLLIAATCLRSNIGDHDKVLGCLAEADNRRILIDPGVSDGAPLRDGEAPLNEQSPKLPLNFE